MLLALCRIYKDTLTLSLDSWLDEKKFPSALCLERRCSINSNCARENTIDYFLGIIRGEE